jgi:hypothetical protein
MATIVPVSQLQPAFDNAMDQLIRAADVKTVGDALRKWKEHYDCYLIHDSDFVWESVGFKDEEQLSWFMLKWS